MPDVVLVVGGTGLLGRPVAQRLLHDGYQVRLLVRSTAHARASLGDDFDYVQGDVRDAESLGRAVRGCVGVNVSLSARTPEEFDRIEHRGTANSAFRLSRLVSLP